MKDRRRVVPNEDDKKQRRFVLIDALSLETHKQCAAGSNPMERKVFWSGASLQISMSVLAYRIWRVAT